VRSLGCSIYNDAPLEWRPPAQLSQGFLNGKSTVHSSFAPAFPASISPPLARGKTSMALRRFIIECDTPKVRTFEHEQLPQAEAKSDAIQWVKSFATDDKTFCVYLAKDEAVIRKHAEISGFSVTRITEVRAL
jgi:uncharacterized protein DUF4242